MAKLTNGCLCFGFGSVDLTKSKHIFDTSTYSRLFYSNSLSSLVFILCGEIFTEVALDLYDFEERFIQSNATIK